MDGKKWQDRWIGPVRETLQKLSPAQRISLGVLGASLLVGLCTMALSNRSSEEMTLFPVSNAEERVSFASWLDDMNIAHQVEEGGISVPRSQIDHINLQARILHAEGKRTDHFAWVDQAVSFQETNRARSDKWSVATKRDLEDALRRSRGIRDATVHFTPSRRRTSYGRTQDPGARASIQLELDSAVYKDRLPLRQARVAAQFVAGALGLNMANVSVTDNHLNEYRDLSASAALGSGDENPEPQIKAKISDIVEQDFPIGSFEVIVDVNIDRNLRESRERKIDAENAASLTKRKTTEKAKNHLAGSAPGLEPNVAKAILGGTDGGTAAMDEFERTDTEFENFVGDSETTIRYASGTIQDVAITLALQASTAKEIFEEEKRLLGVEDWQPDETELQAEFDKYAEEWRTRLSGALSLPSERVKTNVHFATRPKVPDTALLDSGGRGLLAWLGENSGSLVLVTLALVGGFFLVRVARGGVPEVVDLPDPVAELEEYLAKREERIAAEVAEREVELADDVDMIHENWEASSSDQETLDLLEEVIRFAQDEPSTASGVLRQWIHEGPQSPAQGGSAS